MSDDAPPLRLTLEGRIVVLTLSDPPLNALGAAMRAALGAALDEIEAAPALRAAVLCGEGKNFAAGADIREFGTPRAPPLLRDLVTRLEALPFPVVAALHGACLGGGLELALGAHRRIALPSALLGFPEVTLGLLPGAGGTQRAPRLAGVAAALDLVTSGRRIGGEEALTLGLVDALSDATDPRAAGLAEARRLIAGEVPHARTGALRVSPDAPALTAKRAALERTRPRLTAPLACLEAIAASVVLPLSEGLARERALFEACEASAQSRALVHAFFAERTVAEVPEAAATPLPVETVAVIGGGTMGAGIATAVLQVGLAVTLVERDRATLGRGEAAVRANLDAGVARGKTTPEDRDAALARLTGATDMAAVGAADLVIEAVFEEMEVKRAVFAEIDRHARAGAVLATNTSYLDVAEIAAATARPGDVIGLHFFSPAHVMRLLEVVVPEGARAEAVATGFALGRRLRKVAVRAGNSDGFVGNRILTAYRTAAEHMVLDGAAPFEVDAALRGFGFAMGPFEVSDLAGLDIGWANRKRLAPDRDPADRYSAVADRLCERGWFGRKTGRGYYLHAAGTKPVPNPELDAILAAERAKEGRPLRSFGEAEIVERALVAMAVEAVRVVEEGVALRASDVDAVMIFGYGFPRHEGGPLHWAEATGYGRVIETVERLAGEDPGFWRVPGLLRELAARPRDRVLKLEQIEKPFYIR